MGESVMIANRFNPLGVNNRPYDAEIEYLESVGGQYINMDFICDDTSGFIVDAKTTSVGNYNERLIGSYCGDNGRWCFAAKTEDSFNNSAFYGWNTAVLLSRYNVGGFINRRFTISLNLLNDRLFRVDGVAKGNLSETLYSPQTNSALLFSHADATTGLPALNEFFIGRVYSAKITRGVNIVRDFIPVRVGNVGYMFDRISGKLFGNQGTGAFILGADK